MTTETSELIKKVPQKWTQQTEFRIENYVEDKGTNLLIDLLN